MIYCDTSVLVAALTQEADTKTVQDWLAEQEPGQLCVSGWTITEFSCALSRKARRGDLTREQRAQVLTRWRVLLSNNLEMASVPPEAFVAAASYADRDDFPLRAGDALHLAIAAKGSHQLATLDKVMAAASAAAGVSVVEIA